MSLLRVLCLLGMIPTAIAIHFTIQYILSKNYTILQYVGHILVSVGYSIVLLFVLYSVYYNLKKRGVKT